MTLDAYVTSSNEAAALDKKIRFNRKAPLAVGDTKIYMLIFQPSYFFYSQIPSGEHVNLVTFCIYTLPVASISSCFINLNVGLWSSQNMTSYRLYQLGRIFLFSYLSTFRCNRPGPGLFSHHGTREFTRWNRLEFILSRCLCTGLTTPRISQAFLRGNQQNPRSNEHSI